jgi:arylsulfatase A-like enzyme
MSNDSGIATPRIAHWPAGIPAARCNALVHEPGQLLDIMATCVDMAGAQYLTKFKGQSITPLEGRGLTLTFVGDALTCLPGLGTPAPAMSTDAPASKRAWGPIRNQSLPP